MAILTNQKPTIYCNLYENTAPDGWTTGLQSTIIPPTNRRVVQPVTWRDRLITAVIQLLLINNWMTNLVGWSRHVTGWTTLSLVGVYDCDNSIVQWCRWMWWSYLNRAECLPLRLLVVLLTYKMWFLTSLYFDRIWKSTYATGSFRGNTSY